jgi:hypothetical protein
LCKRLIFEKLGTKTFPSLGTDTLTRVNAPAHRTDRTRVTAMKVRSGIRKGTRSFHSIFREQTEIMPQTDGI